MKPVKETDKTPVTEPEETGICELSEKVFRIILLKKSSKLLCLRLLYSMVSRDSGRFSHAGSAESPGCQQKSYLTPERNEPADLVCLLLPDWRLGYARPGLPSSSSAVSPVLRFLR